MFSFRLECSDPTSGARLGVLETSRGVVKTPLFMPVGTAGSVKATPHESLEELDYRLILANTYHLYLRPGTAVIAESGGLHRFISWPKTILSDSGGYQVFSHRELVRIEEEGVQFRSHLDGSRHFFTPERSMEVQGILGSDIAMAFDDCTPYPVTVTEAADSMRRSMRWAERCRKVVPQGKQALFGIVQGSTFVDLRLESLEKLLPLEFDGIAVGGFSVGEPKPLMFDILEEMRDRLPVHLPRYLMGVGTPVDLVRAVGLGFDMFDCVLPTRNARNGTLFTWRGPIRIKNACYRCDPNPIDEACRCKVCQRYSRAYLRHLFVAGELSALILNTYHNLHFYKELMDCIGTSIRDGSLAGMRRRLEEAYQESGLV
ncbi:MAG TPA: tRNA guanosine(34) transglycosylase Tgt [Acidobacteriota bacterium]|nr:tRNA guanosine(34) transglycosylase Tgt [Acidobacteriota bacterium]